MSRLLLLSSLIMSVVSTACSESKTPSIESYKTLESSYSNPLVRVVAVGNVPEEHLRTTLQVVTDRGRQLVQNLGSDPLPQSSVYIWEERDDFESAYGEKNNFTRGFVHTDEWAVHVHYTNRSPAKGALHEYAHLVLYSLRPTIASESRWLWETIPIYISNRPPAPKLASLKCISSGSTPSFQNLNEHGSNIYRIGFHIGDFLIGKWGWGGVAKLLRNGGDIEAAFGIDETEFHRVWLEHLNIQRKEFSQDC
ncbi:MAG: hypothetical protein GKR90_22745 [Pseudomonadales bacterium]|nr:hypothetical protein [Pseudomonadales bacterium]